MAIVFDAASTDKITGSSPHTLEHTVTSSGSNGYLVVGVEAHDTPIDSVAYGGDSMTQLQALTSWDSNNGNDLEYWYLLSPSTGTNNVEVSFSSGAEFTIIAAMSFTGVDQNSPHGTVGTNTVASDTDISVDITSEDGEVVVDLVAYNAVDPVADPGPGQTARFGQGQDTGSGGADDHSLEGSTEGGAPTVTMSWTEDNNRQWALIAVPLRPASGGRQLSTRYHINTGVNRAAGRTVVLDTLGRDVPMEQIKTDEWTHMGGAFFPTTRRFQNLIADRSRGYNESVSSRDANTSNARARIAVRKESQLDFILRRLTRGSV